MLSKLTNSQKTAVLILATLTLANLLTHGPDLLRYINTPPDKWFTGQASWFDPWDINIYFSAIGWGKRGGFLFENLYDTEAIQALPVYSLYTALGKTAALFNLPNISTLHFASIISCFLLATVVWWFIKIFLEEETERMFAFAFVFLGGGLGWLFFPENLLPDLGLPNFTLARAVGVPHEAVSLGLFLLALGGLWQGSIHKKNGLLLVGGLSSLLMLFFHPYNIIPLGVALFCFGFYRWAKTESVISFTPSILVGLGGVVYYFLIARHLLANPSFSGLTSQTQYSPSLLHVILGWGLLSPLILVALFSKDSGGKIAFVKIWFATHFLAIYLPIGFQKLMIRGLWIPAVILAVRGAKEICRKLNWDYRTFVGPLLVFATFSTFFMSYKRITESPENRWIYLTKEEGGVIEYFKTHGEDEEGVLASYRIANIIPAHTAKRVLAGHTFQSPNFEERINETYRFFAGEMDDAQAKEFFQKANISWIFWGPDEKAIKALTEISNKDVLEPAVENSVVSLYRVRK